MHMRTGDIADTATTRAAIGLRVLPRMETPMIFGTVDDQHNVTIAFNAKADSLEAWQPRGFAKGKWHPCAACGIVEAVTPGILYFVCDACIGALNNPEIRTELLYVGRCLEVNTSVSRAIHDEEMRRGWHMHSYQGWLKLALRRDRENEAAEKVIS